MSSFTGGVIRVPDESVTGDLITGILSGPGVVKVSGIFEEVDDGLQPTIM